MNVKSIYRHVVLVLFLAIPRLAMSQVMEDKFGVDTLSIAERIALRTNVVDWTLTTPNVGVEFDLCNVNWNRWTVGLNFKYNWQAKHTFNPGMVYNIAEAKLEVRNYWRIKNDVKVPYKKRTYTFYKGLYVAYDKFSLMLSGSGSQGKAVSGGVSLGVIKPFYKFKNGNSMDFEIGASAGISYINYDKYRLDRDANCYHVTESGKTTILPMINDLRVGLVYRFGNYPITKKYRWRIEADLYYKQLMQDSLSNMEMRRANEIKEINSYNDMLKAYSAAYDSALVIVKKEEAEKLKQEAANKAKAAAQAAAKAKQAQKDSVETKPISKDSVEAVKLIEQDSVPVQPVAEDSVPAQPVAEDSVAAQPVAEDSVATEPVASESDDAKPAEEEGQSESAPAEDNQDNSAVPSDDNNGKEAKDEE